jgi:hypothetical protein
MTDSEMLDGAYRAVLAEVAHLQVLADAEMAWDAATVPKPPQPWPTSRTKLAEWQREEKRQADARAARQREDDEQRRQQEQEEHGNRLVAAYTAWQEATATIARVTAEHDQLDAELQRLETCPVVIKWQKSRERAAQLGLDHTYKQYAEFFESGRDWRLGPQAVLQAAKDGFVSNLISTWSNTGLSMEKAREYAMPLRFTDEDRAVVLQARKQREVVREVSVRLAAARDRRAELLDAYPALRTIDATETQLVNV